MNDSARQFDAEFVPGFFPSLPAAVYHATSALSASGAKKILRSPQHFKVWRDQPSEPSAAMRLGTAIHAGVLEPETFAEQVVCAPVLNARTNAGKEALAAFEAANAGRLILAPDVYATAQACIESVRAHPAAQDLLRGAEVEGSMFWHDAKCRVPCKARFDARNHGGLVDLKSCTDASPEAFAQSAAKFMYHAQGAHYFSGAEHVFDATPQFFALICVETEPPYATACYTLDGPTIMAGARLMDRALERYKAALDSGSWQGYPASINRLPFPRWALTFRE